MPNSGSDSDSCIILQLYGTGIRSAVNPSLEVSETESDRKTKCLNKSSGSYQ